MVRRLQDASTVHGPSNHHELTVIIVGAGFSGLCMAIQLKQAGIHAFLVLEQGDRVGGVWRANHYPGAACDIQSHLYSFSFASHYAWSRAFARQPEIQQYLEQCASTYDILPHVRFNTAVTRAAFDRQAGCWTVDTADGQSLSARALVAATGQLTRPAMPAIPGLSAFGGHIFHSACWDHGYDLRGRTVAVIGTGASAIQFVPQIAPLVAQLYLFQRSAPWVLPKLDRLIHAPEQRLLAQDLWMRAYRAFLYCANESLGVGFANPLGLKRLARAAEWIVRWQIRRHIADARLRRLVTPTYPLGCKRVLISNDWYPTLGRDNVELIPARIDRIERHAIVDDTGTSRPIDCLILGTGFDTQGFLPPMQVIGSSGEDLQRQWRRHGAEAYKGISVAGFPNLFFLYGPNTNLGHQSIVFMIESQVHYVRQCIQLLADGHLRYMDVRPGRQQQYNERLQRQLQRSVWGARCTSWYKTTAGKVTHQWPGFTFTYRRLTSRVCLSDYDLTPSPADRNRH